MTRDAEDRANTAEDDYRTLKANSEEKQKETNDKLSKQKEAVSQTHKTISRIQKRSVDTLAEKKQLEDDYSKHLQTLFRDNDEIHRLNVSVDEITGKNKGYKLNGFGLNGQSVHSDPQIF